ncbi:hypothetical protein DYI25_21935 [Mesobacillus boroniphilus]|uniref:Uncharacterized protein n=1 Tax=Mesobacillus boroniphilus TaxID=308892 RepID=A0A944CPL3_9BACI|nr:hypothetical protein [Mesobacillus boroniphilus]
MCPFVYSHYVKKFIDDILFSEICRLLAKMFIYSQKLRFYSQIFYYLFANWKKYIDNCQFLFPDLHLFHRKKVPIKNQDFLFT